MTIESSFWPLLCILEKVKLLMAFSHQHEKATRSCKEVILVALVHCEAAFVTDSFLGYIYSSLIKIKHDQLMHQLIDLLRFN